MARVVCLCGVPLWCAAGLATVSGDSIDTMAWHLVIVGIAVLLGYSVKQVLIAASTSLGGSFPLFPLAMLAGLAMQVVLQRFDTSKRLVDHHTMDRIAGTSLDFLIVGAIASVNVDALAGNLVPIVIICISGIAWEIVCVLFVSPIMHPSHWFENGICVFGQDTGVIAAGLMLLKMVDPQSRTPVPAAFGFKQPLHSAFMGGGIVTALFISVQKSVTDPDTRTDPGKGKGGVWISFFICGGACALVWIVWFFALKRNFAETKQRLHNETVSMLENLADAELHGDPDDDYNESYDSDEGLIN